MLKVSSLKKLIDSHSIWINIWGAGQLVGGNGTILTEFRTHHDNAAGAIYY
jgi:hypothetical protein